MKTFNRSWTR